jgi:dolichol kinase
LREINRQLFHVALGLALLFVLLNFGRSKTVYFLSGILFVGLLLINLVVRGIRVPVATWFVEAFERKNAPLPGYGSAWYVVGLLISCLLIHNANYLAAAVVVFAFGDAASTIFGLGGKHPLPYNPKKTVEGTLGFVLFALSSFLFVGWSAVPLALFAALVESLPLGIDDNLGIPLACTLFFYFA